MYTSYFFCQYIVYLGEDKTIYFVSERQNKLQTLMVKEYGSSVLEKVDNIISLSPLENHTSIHANNQLNSRLKVVQP